MRQKASILAVVLGAVLPVTTTGSPAQPAGAPEQRCIPVEEALTPFGPPTTQDPRYIPRVSAEEAPLSYFASVPRGTMEVGKRVEFTLSIRNSGSAPAPLSFSTAQRYDVVVWNDDCVQVWRWSWGRAFAQASTSLDVPARGVTVYRIPWDQRDQAGHQVRIGAYEARVVFLGKSMVRSQQLVFSPLIFAVR